MPLVIYGICFAENLAGFGFFFTRIGTVYSPQAAIVTYCTLLTLGMGLFAAFPHALTARPGLMVPAHCALRLIIWQALWQLVPPGAAPAAPAFVLAGLGAVYALDLGLVTAWGFYACLTRIRRGQCALFTGGSLAFAVLLTLIAGKLSSDPAGAGLWLGTFCEIAIAISLRQICVAPGSELPAKTCRQISAGMRRHLRAAVLITVILSVLSGMIDALESQLMQDRLQLNPSDDVVQQDFRLLYALSLIAAGVLYARLRQLQLLFAVLSAGIMLLTLFLHQAAIPAELIFAVQSAASGFIMLFIMNVFADAAYVVPRPELWCNAGRIIYYPVSGICTVTCAGLFGSAAGELAAFGICLVLLMCLTILLYRDSMSYRLQQQLRAISKRLERTEGLLQQSSALRAGSAAQNPAVSPPPGSGSAGDTGNTRSAENAQSSDEHKHESGGSSSLPPQRRSAAGVLAQRYGLTARETEVLMEIAALRPIRDMAAKLGITERTVKYRITVILRKTGAVSQKDLLRRLMEQES